MLQRQFTSIGWITGKIPALNMSTLKHNYFQHPRTYPKKKYNTKKVNNDDDKVMHNINLSEYNTMAMANSERAEQSKTKTETKKILETVVGAS